jgi:hypothetical protein
MRFPRGLSAPNLFFSGVSPDGWLTDHARVVLALSGGSNVLHLTGNIPNFSRKISDGVMRITVDETLVLERPQSSGSFDIAIPIPKADGSRNISFKMTGADRLPSPDDRLVSLHLTSISLENSEETLSAPDD